MSAVLDPAAPEEFGPYLVYERLGLGGMAQVHRAKKTGIAGFERGVALKRMLAHLAEDPGFVESFVREAKVASLLVHPNIAQIYDFGRIGGIYYIAMEHVEGFDVRRLLRHANRIGEPIPMPVVLSLLAELCDALEYAHTFPDEQGVPIGIVHRDVSPSNMIVAHTGHLKVIDFGIAKASTRQLRTESGRVKGKLGYMSPEVAMGNVMGAVSDMFSVGVVAHELLTARPLFSSRTDFETMLRIREGEIYPPSRRNPLVSARLDDVVLGALERDPRARTQSAGLMRAQLEEVAHESGIRFGARDVVDYIARIPREDGNPSTPSGRSAVFGVRASSQRSSELPLPPAQFTPHPEDDADDRTDVWADDQPLPQPAPRGDSGDFSMPAAATRQLSDDELANLPPARRESPPPPALAPAYQSKSIPSLAASPHVVMLPASQLVVAPQHVSAPLLAPAPEAPAPAPASRRRWVIPLVLAALAISGVAIALVLAGGSGNDRDRGPTVAERAPVVTPPAVRDPDPVVVSPTPPSVPSTPTPRVDPPTDPKPHAPAHPTPTTNLRRPHDPPVVKEPKPADPTPPVDPAKTDPTPKPDPNVPKPDPTPTDTTAKPDPNVPKPDPGPKRVPVVAAGVVTKLAGELPAIHVSGGDASSDVLVKVCIDEHGAVTSAVAKKAPAEIATQIATALRAWRYKPYAVGGAASAVCFPLSLRLVIAH